MNGSRNQFLACARFAINQDAPVGRRGNGYLLAKRAHGDAFAYHHAIVELLAQPLVIGFKLSLPQRIANGQYSALNLQRLLDEVERA